MPDAVWSFRRVTREDFPLVASWLAQPEVHRWWQHEWSAAAVERDFGSSVDGAEPNEDWLALG
ncbi:GNAT family N-acetyltransferase, partial [Nostocoides australiense]|nr:GNAT family N-acetyltransferase [Tetrasphaera australiensis]HRW02991.1 GNAT family N-acetyltransferase [Tetrasphaera sp.]